MWLWPSEWAMAVLHTHPNQAKWLWRNSVIRAEVTTAQQIVAITVIVMVVILVSAVVGYDAGFQAAIVREHDIHFRGEQFRP
jgi:hypothetical protein